MSKRRTRMTLPVEGIKAATTKAFHFIKYYLAAAFLAVAFFTHFFLPHPEVGVRAAQVDRSEVEQQIATLKDEIIATADVPPAMRDKLQTLELQYTHLDDQYDEVAAESRLFGYPSRHKFMWSFGLGMIILALSMRISYLSFEIKEKYRRRSNLAMGLVGSVIGGYFFAWIFYPAPDLPYAAYMAIIVGLGVVISAMSYFLTRALYERRFQMLQLRGKLQSMLDFFVELKTVHYKNLLKLAVRKDLHDPEYQAAIKTNSKKFDERIYDKAEELVD